MQHLFLDTWLALLLLISGSLAGLQQATPSPSPTPVRVEITSPRPGQALQGSVQISGNTAVEGFQSAELDFSYAGPPAKNWFLLAEARDPVGNGTLAQWDTTTISDGIYNLRLTVKLVGGSQATASVAGVRVRNYTPVETDTPTPVTPTATPVPGDTPVPTATTIPTATPVPPTASPLPPNPAQLSRQNVAASTGKGALAIVALFAMVGLYSSLRRVLRR